MRPESEKTHSSPRIQPIPSTPAGCSPARRWMGSKGPGRTPARSLPHASLSTSATPWNGRPRTHGCRKRSSFPATCRSRWSCAKSPRLLVARSRFASPTARAPRPTSGRPLFSSSRATRWTASHGPSSSRMGYMSSRRVTSLAALRAHPSRSSERTAMSTPDRQARLDVTSPTESLQISLIDSTFAQIASGSGALMIDDVRPGIYELRLSASTATDTRLIRLRPGDVFRETVDLSFPTAVPLPQSTTWNEAHQIAATRASEHVVRQASSQRGAGGLLVMARATQSSDEPLAVPQFELTRESEPIRVAKENWWRGSGRDWIVQAATVEPGGYGLRTWGEDGTAVEQSLWVSEGWQTLAFVPFGLLGLAPSRASVVMLSIRQPWGPGLAEPTWEAAELAIAGLRERRTVLPHDVLDLLVREKFIDPMLGVLAAHALLLEPRIDFETLDVVVNNLATLLAGAPDGAPLVALGEEPRSPADRPQPDPSPLHPLRWPPMLPVAYTAPLRLAAPPHGPVIPPP